MIAVTDLRKVYSQANREVRALDGVTLSVPDDSVHGVIGSSGAGKSTLVRCIALLDRPTSGVVEVNGTDLTAVRSADLRRARQLSCADAPETVLEKRMKYRLVALDLDGTLLDSQLQIRSETIEALRRENDADLWALISDDQRALDWALRGMGHVVGISHGLTGITHQGVLAMLRSSLHQLGLPARWLAQPDGGNGGRRAQRLDAETVQVEHHPGGAGGHHRTAELGDHAPRLCSRGPRSPGDGRPGSAGCAGSAGSAGRGLPIREPGVPRRARSSAAATRA